jgi:hypothetical protein
MKTYSTCLIKHGAMRLVGRMEVQHHGFLTLALDGNEWLAFLPGRFPPVPIG